MPVEAANNHHSPKLRTLVDATAHQVEYNNLHQYNRSDVKINDEEAAVLRWIKRIMPWLVLASYSVTPHSEMNSFQMSSFRYEA